MGTDHLAEARNVIEHGIQADAPINAIAHALIDIAESLRVLGAVADSLREMAISQEAI
ncbi:hypothetical protein [Mycolicibacterium mageritense]|uniref:hypothetical protein n=1 Tax=Mycolicibacterium mageritense TaxID=53462 RepID=UPI001E56313A|nr:hypothetical protein [Mycolicibacterium mageritense]GJJ24046.1 hypothetical protein MTY414_77200 [Mycolicibacterium mageritense]